MELQHCHLAHMSDDAPRRRGGEAYKHPSQYAYLFNMSRSFEKSVETALAPIQPSRLAGQAEATPFIFSRIGLIRALLSIPGFSSYFLSFSFLSLSKEARLEKGL